MFKKSLLALTIAGASVTTANAADVVTSVTEYLAGNATAAVVTATGANDVNDVCFTLGFADTDNATIDVLENIDGAYDRVSKDDAAPVADDLCVVKESLVTTPVASSIEAAALGTVTLQAKIVAGIGGYEDESTITVDITGAPINLTTTVAPTLTWNVGGANSIPVLDISAQQVRFTVPVGADVPAGAIITINDVFLDATALTESTEVKVASKATNSAAVDYDPAVETTVLTLAPQYAASVTTSPWNGIIDVADDRQALTVVAPDVANEDTLTINLAHTTVGAGAPGNVVPSKITTTISGNFAWLAAADLVANGGDADGDVEDAEVLAYLNATATAAAGGVATFFVATTDDTLASVSVNSDMDELTTVVNVVGGAFGSADASHNYTLAVEGKGTGNPVLVATDYSATVVVTDAVAAPNTTSMPAGTVNAGAWTLNGSVVTIPYMPFDDNTAVIMRHTNTGVQTGDITVRYMLEGTSTDWETAGVVGSSSRGVQNIRDLVMNAIKAASGVDAGKVAIEITTNVPKDDVTVYAAYKVKDEQDRGFVGTYGKRGSTAAN